jgi:hypothetical protein
MWKKQKTYEDGNYFVVPGGNVVYTKYETILQEVRDLQKH